MNREYKDIIDRLGPPFWWDDQICPRYAEFHPNLCGVYDDQVALLLIECQFCREKFRMAKSWSKYDYCLMPGNRWELEPSPHRDKDWYYVGDPPRHECTGDTMSSDTIKILRFWRRVRDNEEALREWKRFEFEEIEIDQSA